MTDHTGQAHEKVECWHCKSKHVETGGYFDDNAKYVRCQNCKAKGPHAETVAEAIALWNTRPIEAALRQERDRLRAALREISCHPHTQNLLWWQKKAREALSDE